MPLNPLFWIVLALLATAGAANALRQRRSQDDRALEKGKTPGYSRTPGKNVSLDESVVALDGAHWRPLSLETFHSSERSRLILSMEIDSVVQDIKGFLQRLAAETQARTHANVVYLEVYPRDGQDEERPEDIAFLYAADGLGWSGHERLQMVYRADKAEIIRPAETRTT
jgi:hypothetical protein